MTGIKWKWHKKSNSLYEARFKTSNGVLYHVDFAKWENGYDVSWGNFSTDDTKNAVAIVRTVGRIFLDFLNTQKPEILWIGHESKSRYKVFFRILKNIKDYKISNNKNIMILNRSPGQTKTRKLND